MMDADRSPARYARDLTAMFLYYLPVFYVSIILAVTLHEIAGHGLAALAAGGKFKGFGIYPDGMGWADIDTGGLSAPRTAFVLLAGGAATTLVSGIFFVLGCLFRKYRYAHAAFLIFAFVGFLDGVPYFFWDSVFLGGIGDFSMISMLYPGGPLRFTVIAGCGFLLAAGIIVFNIVFFGVSCRLLSGGCRRGKGERAALAAILFVMEAAGWFAFDWNGLVPGVGILPGVTALLLTAAVMIFLTVKREAQSALPGDVRTAPAGISGRTARRSCVPIIAAWICCAITVFVVILWTGNGVYF